MKSHATLLKRFTLTYNSLEALTCSESGSLLSRRVTLELIGLLMVRGLGSDFVVLVDVVLAVSTCT